jgi:hypothetical protein
LISESTIRPDPSWTDEGRAKNHPSETPYVVGGSEGRIRSRTVNRPSESRTDEEIPGGSDQQGSPGQPQSSAPLRRRGKRNGIRRVFTGELPTSLELFAVDPALGVELRLRRGCWTIETDRDGAEVSRTREERRQLGANIGDWLVLVPVDLDDDRMACVEVVAIAQDGTPRVASSRGELAGGPVHVLPARKARAPSKPKRTPGGVAKPGAPIVERLQRLRAELARAASAPTPTTRTEP